MWKMNHVYKIRDKRENVNKEQKLDNLDVRTVIRFQLLVCVKIIWKSGIEKNYKLNGGNLFYVPVACKSVCLFPAQMNRTKIGRRSYCPMEQSQWTGFKPISPISCERKRVKMTRSIFIKLNVWPMLVTRLTSHIFLRTYATNYFPHWNFVQYFAHGLFYAWTVNLWNKKDMSPCSVFHDPIEIFSIWPIFWTNETII